jgi:VWFA-related protein
MRSLRWLPTVLLLAAGVHAQTPDSPGRITARVELVNVDVTVTDGRGEFVRGLKAENFRIFDDGVEQRITYFAPVEAPAVVLVLVETGPAVYLIHRQHLASAYTLLEGLGDDDQVALASYDQTARLLLPFSADKRAVAQALTGLRYNLGAAELGLFDAVNAALEWLAPIPGKKTLVLMSTGLDTSGRWDALEEKLRSRDVSIYAVGLGGDLRDYRGEGESSLPTGTTPLSFEEATKKLNAMAELTGGRVWFPRRREELDGIYRQLAAQLRHRYSLGFEPGVRDGRYHRIHVQLADDTGRVLGPWYDDLPSVTGTPAAAKAPGKKDRVRYRLFFRRGYLAPVN